MSKIRFFGIKTPKEEKQALNGFVIIRKAEDIKHYGYKSRYSEQTAFLRDVLGERSPCFNGFWGAGLVK